ncbi:MAG TPA: hypothetical protein VGG10_18745 [Rhizomicrobium sp.]|jgi:hypothetical protein
MTRRNVIVLYRGREMTLSQAMRESGCILPLATVRSRIANGWSVPRALSLPAVNRAQRFALRSYGTEPEKP